MFWRFGFQNASAIDSILDRDDVSLEAILDEDDLLQECKAQNTRLIDYFQRVDVLKKLLGYVTGQIECEGQGRFKYPYVAAEVLCSEIWSIVETCVSNADQLLVPFWETVLDRPPEEMKEQMVMASHFAKIVAVFLTKKPAEMLAFIQSQPKVVERLLKHIETPAFVDLLVRIIQLDEHPAGAGVLEWLSRENLMGRLIDMMSPSYSPDVHTIVAELIKGIISMAAPSPGAGLGEGLQNGPASNRFARELAHPTSVAKLADYILGDFKSNQESQQAKGKEPEPSGSGPSEMSTTTEEDYPNVESSTSSVVNSISIIVELIRKNNSDYFEPYLFHTLRNRLITLQQHLPSNADDARETLEGAMKEMVDRMGVVHLGSVLDMACKRLDEFQKYLRKPRSLDGPVHTTVGAITPLTFERFRICELYAELLHCSNMGLLNRPPEYAHLYDSDGLLQGGLNALEELAKVIALGNGDDQEQDAMDDEEKEDLEPAMDFPISGASHDSLIDSDEEMSGSDGEPGSSDDDAMEEIAMSDESASPSTSPSAFPHRGVPLHHAPSINISSIGVSSASPPVESPGPLPVPIKRKASSLRSSDSSNSLPGRPRSNSSRRSLRRSTVVDNPPVVSIPIGERLKERFLEANVMGTVLDLFFEFPWNNFLHSVVYDLLHQVLTARMDGRMSRELVISLFRDARLMQRIVDGQKRNDEESLNPKGVRLGYMGHLTLISEDVICALEHYPPDLRLAIAQYAPQPEWDNYVGGRYRETKTKDQSLLGGGKPVMSAAAARAGARWNVDEAESRPSNIIVEQVTGEEDENSETLLDEIKSGLQRNGMSRRQGSDDFGSAMMDEDDDEHPHFARYLAQEMQSPDHFESGSSSDASDEEDEGGWLTQSTFGMGSSSAAATRLNGERRTFESNGFDDAFNPASSSSAFQSSSNDPFQDDEDAFGPFSDSAAASGSDPFTFSSALSEDMDTVPFDDFGDFGDFQGAADGQLTPTAGSWTFTSNSSIDIGSEEDSSGAGASASASGGTSTEPAKGQIENMNGKGDDRTASALGADRKPS